MRPPAHSSNDHLEPPTPRWFGVLAGLTAAIVALGVAELVAGLNRSWRSPVLDVGDRAIDRAPRALKDFAIETFGTKDKPILLASIGLVLAVYAAVVGMIAVRRSVALGMAGIAAFGVIGVLAAAARRSGGTVIDGTPSAVGAVVGAVALWWICRQLATSGSASVELIDGAEAEQPDVDRAGVGISRRSVLARGGRLVALLSVAGGGAAAIGRAIASRFSAAESRAAVRLPAPIEALAPLPAAASVDVAGMTPFITPNKDFYRIDTALTVPQVPIEGWELRIHGMVDRELRISFDELLGRGLREYDITLTCVSNVVGGELVGNARWLGVRLDELLAEAGVQAEADQVVGRSFDGYTCGFPVDAATDGRNAIVAVAMNGEPLPLEHGFPARLVVPGLYGYISATKWLTEIELTTFERFESYWVPRGYADRAPIKLMSRIDSVDGLGNLARNADGGVAIGGVAWAQTIGISAVEVQIDDGPWMPAELGESLGKDTWRQWAYRWTPAAAGRTSIRCRAIDGNGVIQTDERTEPLPDGASGHHQIIVFIK